MAQRRKASTTQKQTLNADDFVTQVDSTIEGCTADAAQQSIKRLITQYFAKNTQLTSVDLLWNSILNSSIEQCFSNFIKREIINQSMFFDEEDKPVITYFVKLTTLDLITSRDIYEINDIFSNFHKKQYRTELTEKQTITIVTSLMQRVNNICYQTTQRDKKFTFDESFWLPANICTLAIEILKCKGYMHEFANILSTIMNNNEKTHIEQKIDVNNDQDDETKANDQDTIKIAENVEDDTENVEDDTENTEDDTENVNDDTISDTKPTEQFKFADVKFFVIAMIRFASYRSNNKSNEKAYVHDYDDVRKLVSDTNTLIAPFVLREPSIYHQAAKMTIRLKGVNRFFLKMARFRPNGENNEHKSNKQQTKNTKVSKKHQRPPQERRRRSQIDKHYQSKQKHQSQQYKPRSTQWLNVVKSESKSTDVLKELDDYDDLKPSTTDSNQESEHESDHESDHQSDHESDQESYQESDQKSDKECFDVTQNITKLGT